MKYLVEHFYLFLSFLKIFQLKIWVLEYGLLFLRTFSLPSINDNKSAAVFKVSFTGVKQDSHLTTSSLVLQPSKPALDRPMQCQNITGCDILTYSRREHGIFHHQPLWGDQNHTLYFKRGSRLCARICRNKNSPPPPARDK